MTHHFDNEQKVSILISGLEERYKSIHAIRDRIQSVCIWALGLMLAASGWLIQSDVHFTPCEKFAYIIGIIVAFWALRFNFLADLYKGFKSQQQVAVRLEKALGMFTPKMFDDELSIYPKEWTEAGSVNGGGQFFASTYLLLYIGVVALILAILMQDGQDHFHHIQHLQYFVR